MKATDDLTDPEVIDRPYEYFGHLRETDPVHRNEMWGGWIVTRYEDVKQCFRDDEHLSLEAQASRLEQAPADIPETESMFPKWLIFQDPPDHTELRHVIAEAFNPELVAEQQREITEITDSLIQDIEQRDVEEFDLIEEFAYPLPVRIISEIMGFPPEDADKVGKWSRDIGLTLFHYYDAEDRHQKTERSVKEFSEYVREIVQDRKRDPQDDLITYLTRAESGGKTLTDDEVVATTILLLFAGHETTTKLIANGVLELLRHPEQFELLREDSSLARSAVEEILRYQGTSKAVTRTVIEDFELRDRRIEAGDRVYLSQAAANRDGRKFDKPEQFDITRGTTEHLGFGHGTRHCLGAPLARLETRIAFPALVRAFPDMELATDELNWVRSPLVRGLEELPVRI